MTKISLVQLSQMENKPKKVKYNNYVYRLNDEGTYYSSFGELQQIIIFKYFNEPLIEIVEEVIYFNFKKDDMVKYCNKIWKVAKICKCAKCKKKGVDELWLKSVDGNMEYIASYEHLKVIEKIDIPLDLEEIKYLNTIIKPFREKIRGIRKSYDFINDEEYLAIEIIRGTTMLMPTFPMDKFYKKMKRNYVYDLEELGLYNE